ncbi:MAG: helix-turn-helix domain-containing protein [Flavobacteriales bacterium]
MSKCPTCLNSERIRKYGKQTTNSKQRFECKDCGKVFRQGAEPRSVCAQQKVKTVQLWLEGLSEREIATIVRVSKSRVHNWVEELTGPLKRIRLDRDQDGSHGDWKKAVRRVEGGEKGAPSSGVLFYGDLETEIWGVRSSSGPKMDEPSG